MAEYGVGEGIGKAVIDGVHNVVHNALMFVGEKAGQAMVAVGGLLSALPLVGEALGGAIASIGARGMRGDSLLADSGPSVSAPAIGLARSPQIQNDYNPITPMVQEQALAMGGPGYSWQEASRDPIGGHKPIQGLPNFVGPSRGASMSI